MISKNRLFFLFLLSCLLSLSPTPPIYGKTTRSKALTEQKIQELYHFFQMAENLRQSGKLTEASQSFYQLLQMAKHLPVDPQFIYEFSYLYALTLKDLNKTSQSLIVLSKIPYQKAPNPLYLKSESLKIEILADLGYKPRAFFTMVDLKEKISEEQWPAKLRILFFTLQETIQPFFKENLVKAESAFKKGEYQNSLPIYKDLLKAIRKKYYTPLQPKEMILKLSYRLAQNHFALEQIDSSIEILLDQIDRLEDTSTLHTIYQESAYLLALCYGKKREIEKKIVILEQYITTDTPQKLPHYAQARWDIAQYYSKHNEYKNAIPHLIYTIKDKRRSPKIKQLARLYLAQARIARQDYTKAEKTLRFLKKSLRVKDPFHIEWQYLQAQIHLNKLEYEKAYTLLDKINKYPQATKKAWYPNALFSLAHCLTIFAEQNPTEQHFLAAEEVYKQLLNSHPSEEGYLALGNLLFNRAERFQTFQDLQAIEALLSPRERFPSTAAYAEALLLRAKATASPDKRHALLEELMQDEYKTTESYRIGWLHMGEYLLKEQAKNPQLYPRTIEALQKAALILKEVDPQLTKQTTYYEIQSHVLYNSTDSNIQALTLLKTLDTPKEELLFLKGVIEIRLADQNSEYLNTGIISLTTLLEHSPESTHLEETLLLLGTAYFQKEEYQLSYPYWSRLIQEFPNTENFSNNLYWEIRCLEHLNTSKEKLYTLKLQFLEKHSQTAYAAEIYFSLFSYGDYLSGEVAPIEHLHLMEEKYPNAPELIYSYYLQGLDQMRTIRSKEGELQQREDLLAAIRLFEASNQAFERLSAGKKLPPEAFSDYRLISQQASIEKGKLHLIIATSSLAGPKKNLSIEYALKTFRQLLEDSSLPPFLTAESQYGLAKALLSSGETKEATKFLAALDKPSVDPKLKAQAWKKLAEIAYADQDYKTSLTYLERLDDARFFPIKEQTDLLFKQSQCYHLLGNLTASIRTLSQIINSDTPLISRTRAMFLRAELYAQKGKKEKAKKQLQATANFEGPWSIKAKEKLENDYEYYR